MIGVGTLMGNSADCPHDDPRQVHTKGMIGGGWRVEGVGGNFLVLTIYSGREPRCRIRLDRNGRIMELEQMSRPSLRGRSA